MTTKTTTKPKPKKAAKKKAPAKKTVSAKKTAASTSKPKARPAASKSKPGRKVAEARPVVDKDEAVAGPVIIEAERDEDPGESEAQDVEPDAEPEIEEDVEEKVTSLVRSQFGPIARLTPLQQYLMEVRRHPLLTREEEQELANAYFEHQDREAARRLVTGNLRLVVKIALEYYRNWMDLLDLVQEGNLGLVQAVKKFDPYRGIRLSTYSSFWIRAYILKFLMDNWRLVKIGTTQAQRKLFFNLKKEKERLELLGFKPGARMLAEALDVKESEVQEMEQRLATRDESLDTPITEDGKQTRESVLADDRPEVDAMLADEEFSSLIRDNLAQFRRGLVEAGNDKELFIFDHRLMSEAPLTLQEVGEKFNVSRERVRQLEVRLLKNLKDFLRQQMPDFEDYDFIQ